MTNYSESFYRSRDVNTRSSAREIVPLVCELTGCKSVVDVGCGVGTWLSVFREFGIQDIYGVDGSWVPEELLVIPHKRFLQCDLSRPIRLSRTFDLVISLEVAEHLSADVAETFVESLVGLGPVILFSAAIPHQGGTHHINEQWPTYWSTLLKQRGYSVIDCVRRRVWSNVEVLSWYAQNTLLFLDSSLINDYPRLLKEIELTSISQLSVVHPRRYVERIQEYQQLTRDPSSLPFRTLLKALPRSAIFSARRRIRQFWNR